MKYIKKFATKSLLDSHLSGEGAEYPLATLTEDDNTFRIITPPTIYYTTTDGNQINNTSTGLSSYIVSHTKEDNGEYKIVLKPTVTSIPNQFFYNQSTLQTLRFEGFDKVTSIGSQFLFQCTSLQSIDLSGLSDVNSIGHNFIQTCRSLQSIDLSGLSNVTSISYSFLNTCSSLQSIDLSPLMKAFNEMKKVPDYFLQGCSLLKTVIMPNTTGITSIGDYYLFNCYSLTTIYCPKGTLEYYKQLIPVRASIMVEMS